mmetsp:Transcript_78325/g.130736  ORF Transcript_78325/g.130736 Transcript_78325/m.130736 type:complete len:100 (+) Transcript_78325:262-561(+)
MELFVAELWPFQWAFKPLKLFNMNQSTHELTYHFHTNGRNSAARKGKATGDGKMHVLSYCTERMHHRLGAGVLQGFVQVIRKVVVGVSRGIRLRAINKA